MLFPTLRRPLIGFINILLAVNGLVGILAHASCRCIELPRLIYSRFTTPQSFQPLRHDGPRIVDCTSTQIESPTDSISSRILHRNSHAKFSATTARFKIKREVN